MKQAFWNLVLAVLSRAVRARKIPVLKGTGETDAGDLGSVFALFDLSVFHSDRQLLREEKLRWLHISLPPEYF